MTRSTAEGTFGLEMDNTKYYLEPECTATNLEKFVCPRCERVYGYRPWYGACRWRIFELDVCMDPTWLHAVLFPCGGTVQKVGETANANT